MERTDAWAGFTPALRFAVCADIHLQTAGDEYARRLQAFVRLAQSAAREDAVFPGLDAVLFAGDLTDHGTAAQYDAFFQTVNEVLPFGTRPLYLLAKNHDMWSEGRNGPKTGFAFFSAHSQQPTDLHTVINGYHFILLSTARDEGVYYAPYQREWLSRELRAAAADAPGKPIFAAHHEPVTGTVYGSSLTDGWGNDYFTDIFETFPQVVHFSGHSHYPLNDPRSVWQGAFTAVGAGALSYAELTVDGVRKIHPAGYERIAQGWLVEADAAGRLRLRGLDALSGKTQCAYVMNAPSGTLALSQGTPECGCAPCFGADAALSVAVRDGAASVTFPAANGHLNDPVFLYRVSAVGADGNVLASVYTAHEYWNACGPENYTAELSLPAGTAALEAAAENAYGRRSAPLRAYV